MFADNDWYGHKKVILQYCNIKKKLPIYGTLQHGYNFNWSKNILAFKASKFFKSAPYYSWNNFLKKNNKIKSLPIGSPFIYLDLLNKNKTYKPKGTLLFPSHSSPEYPQSVDHLKLIKYTKKKFIGPYKVSLFYTDSLNSKIRKLYLMNNFKILTSGHRGNKNFLNNVYKNIANSQYLIFSEFMTPTLYGMYLKKKIGIFEKDEKKNSFSLFTDKAYEYFKKNNPKYFNKKLFSKKDIQNNYKFAANELGLKFIKKKQS